MFLKKFKEKRNLKKILKKEDHHYIKWIMMFNPDMRRIHRMTMHQIVILNDYTDDQIKRYGVDILYICTKRFGLKPDKLHLLDISSIKSIANSVMKWPSNNGLKMWNKEEVLKDLRIYFKKQ